MVYERVWYKLNFTICSTANLFLLLQGDVLVEMYRELYGRAAAFVNGVEHFR